MSYQLTLPQSPATRLPGARCPRCATLRPVSTLRRRAPLVQGDRAVPPADEQRK